MARNASPLLETLVLVAGAYYKVACLTRQIRYAGMQMVSVARSPFPGDQLPVVFVQLGSRKRCFCLLKWDLFAAETKGQFLERT